MGVRLSHLKSQSIHGTHEIIIVNIDILRDALDI
jgi:hypothetical protein